MTDFDPQSVEAMFLELTESVPADSVAVASYDELERLYGPVNQAGTVTEFRTDNMTRNACGTC